MGNVETTCTTGTASKTFSLAHMIVTVQLSVLRNFDIAFTPALPAGIQESVDGQAWYHGFALFITVDTRTRGCLWGSL